MELPYKPFLKIAKQVQILSKYVQTMNVDIDRCTEYSAGKYEYNVNALYTQLVFASVADMHAYSKHLAIIPHKLSFSSEEAPCKYLTKELPEVTGWENTLIMRMLNADTAKLEPNVRLIPCEIPVNFRPRVIKKNPLEVTEGDYTYRILSDSSRKNFNARIRIIARNDEPIYDYLDKGFFVMPIGKEKDNGLEEPIYVVSDSYDINTAHVFMMCALQSSLVDLLKDSCFLSRYEAETIKLKMLKKLTPENKQKYLNNVKSIDEDYRKNTTLVILGKLIAGEIEKTTIRDVIFSKNSVKYENIEIESAGLLDVLSNNMDFNSEFDIYSIAQIHANSVSKALDALRWHQHEIDSINAGNELLKKKATPKFKINGINITGSAGHAGTRYINNIRINQDEIAQAINRAVCSRSAEEYNLFLKSISRMSIKRHDIIANGMRVKIHAGMSRDDYQNPIPSNSAPALKFIIDAERQIKLCIDENRQVPVKIGELITKVKSINSRTNNKSYYTQNGHYGNRDFIWAAEQLAEALVESATFTEKKIKETGEVEEVENVLISKQDVNKLLKVVDEQNKAKIERSKQFLATAIKTTGAEEIEFLGEKAYKVRGSLRSYAVIIKTAKVYDFETKQYRCIVNDRHYKGAGYDDLASRLLALRNDSVMQTEIGTLQGKAQPHYENAHNDYQPERDTQDIISPIVDKLFEKIN